MACFLVPAAEAVVTTIVTKCVESKEKKEDLTVSVSESGSNIVKEEKIPFSRKLKWLNYMLWGGAVLLLFEHLWHGEIVPFFPFLTAANSAYDTAAMLREMATVGVSMAVLVTIIWGIMLLIVSMFEKRTLKTPVIKGANK